MKNHTNEGIGIMVRKINEERIKGTEITIKSNDFWVNIVDFLQQYWAVVEVSESSEHVTVYFLHEGSGIFASMNFDNPEIAQKALAQNGFKRYDDPYENFSAYLNPPKKPYFLVNKQGGSFAT